MKFTFEKDDIPFIDKNLYIEFSKELRSIRKMIRKEYGPIDKTYSTVINFNSSNSIVTEAKEKIKLVKMSLPIYVMNAKTIDEIYQRNLNLSHECIHTITPSSDASKTTYLEEGLAVMFSEKYTNSDSMPPDKYNKARGYVLELLKHDETIIKKLRKKYIHLKLSDYTCEMIKEIIPTVDNVLLQNLTTRFY